jgi:hypothetical protein
VSRKQKFGMEEKAEISELCIPRDYCVLEMKGAGGNRSASSE